MVSVYLGYFNLPPDFDNLKPETDMYYRDSFDEENFEIPSDPDDDFFDDDMFFDEDDVRGWERYTKFEG